MQTTSLPLVSSPSVESEPQCEGAIRFAPWKLCHDGPERGLGWVLARLLCPPVSVAQALEVREAVEILVCTAWVQVCVCVLTPPALHAHAHTLVDGAQEYQTSWFGRLAVGLRC